MRKALARMVLSLTTLLLVGSMVPSQAQSASDKAKSTVQAAPAKEPSPSAKPEKAKTSELEKLLAEALANNPDIRVAEAKLREAEAELNRVRLQTLQKVGTIHHSVEAQKAAMKAAEDSVESQREHYLTGRSTAQEVSKAALLLAQEKAKLASLEAELPAILGRPPQSASPGKGAAAFGVTVQHSPWRYPVVYFDSTPNANSIWSANEYRLLGTAYTLVKPAAAQPAQGAMADKIREALDTIVTIDIKDKPFSGVLSFFEEKAGLSFHTVLPTQLMEETKVSLRLKQVSVGAALQALEDSFPEATARIGIGGLRLAIREYGILVTTRDNLPPGATLLHDFWKGRGGKEKTKDSPTPDGSDSAADRSAPPQNLDGLIKTTDPESGMVTLSLGSDAGLRKGHTLEVYRLKPEPKYLGTIRIVEVRPTEAIGKPTTGSRGTIEAGDRVTSSVRRR